MKSIRARDGHHGNPLYCHHYAVYDMSCEQFEQLRARAGGSCEICGISEKDVFREQLVVDHSHSTGRVRGLVCLRCNQIMSCFDGRKPWGPRFLRWRGSAEEYNQLAHPWGDASQLPRARSHLGGVALQGGSVGRPRTGQIPVQTTRVPQADWDVLDELYGRETSQVIRDFVSWHLRKPGAKLPARPSAEALEQALAKAQRLQLIREFALTLPCPACKVESGPCVTGKRLLETIHRPRLDAATALYDEQQNGPAQQ